MAEGLRLSTVTPTVETSLEKVGELVKLMKSGGGGGQGRGAGLTDTQSQRLMGYMGSLEDMRKQIGIMIQHYEDDDTILWTLTLLIDRIDESLTIVNHSNHGFTHADKGENSDGTLQALEEECILSQSRANASIAVSTSYVLGVSGIQLLPWLFGDAMVEQILEAKEEDEEDNVWDQPLTDHDLAQLDPVTLSPGPSHLAQSFMEDSGEIPEPQPTPSSSASGQATSTQSTKKKGACPPTMCKICYDHFDLWDALFSLSNCDHIYCTECLSGYLHTKIISGGVLDLTCPCPGCNEDVNILDIYSVCNQDTLDKYERFMVLATLRADPNVRWCPMPSCSAAVKGPPKDDSPWITCTNCQLQVCFQCGDERHDPASCGKEAKELIGSRNEAIRKAEEAFEAWHQGKPTDVKPCPKCKAYIEKNQGCNHMTCRSCSFQFCWLCLAQYDSSHFNSDKFPDCKGKQYWYPPVPPDPELAQRYNWIYFPPTYQYAGVDDAPLGHERPAGPSQATRIRTKAKKVGIYVGMGVAIATLGIPAAIIGGPIYGVFKIHKTLKRKKRAQQATTDVL